MPLNYQYCLNNALRTKSAKQIKHTNINNPRIRVNVWVSCLDGGAICRRWSLEQQTPTIKMSSSSTISKVFQIQVLYIPQEAGGGWLFIKETIIKD